MGSLSDYAENKMLDHFLGTAAYTPAATVYIGLSTADPLDTAAGLAEPVGNAYARQSIAFDAAASRLLNQTSLITFPTASGSWGTITHYAIFDASTNGNMLAHGSLSASRTVTSGKTLSIAAGQVDISFNTGGFSNYLAHKMLDLMFRNTAYTAPTIYVALVETTAPTDTSTGATIDELEMTGYAREACAGWDAASGGATANTALIDFGTLSGTGETVVAACLCDSGTTAAGNLLIYSSAVSLPIDTDDTVQFAAGAFDVTLS